MNQQIIPYNKLKRSTDILLSTLLILICSPIFITIILVMALNMLLSPKDRGTFFFRETRISHGKPFQILKFRMVQQPFAQQAHETNTCIRNFENDLSQLTWTGRNLLKNRYLDELPQLFNIVKGDMSFVGPRPLAVPLVQAQINAGIIFRNQIIGGLTSIGQIQYKGLHVDPELSREDLDQQYVDFCLSHNAWQIWCFDMQVLFRTIEVFWQGKGI
ncbi:MAG: hypothetical protein OMM_07395 [Candidatus Magnetoglobus multicellularis str. Araruama]|uniref:Bacterial sugar transferase domain-containing protein n=1 Tax=Candidatus Magnetoglobus multicellularis str. Araruama TaxID=890399 RepID=A0A1V1PCZ7_9BACT|nr:MAG: hypothetical protein OMM_07395 [Candidatus Magnetoglobus multicellularis str. Araruama]